LRRGGRVLTLGSLGGGNMASWSSFWGIQGEEKEVAQEQSNSEVWWSSKIEADDRGTTCGVVESHL
jgi:hypothetical protein